MTQNVKLDTRNGKESRRETLEKGKKLWKKLGKSDEEIARLTVELKPVELPEGSWYLLGAFRDLSATRTYNMAGLPCPISYLEMKAYCDLTGTALSPWEVSTLKLMDETFITANINAKASHEPPLPAVPS